MRILAQFDDSRDGNDCHIYEEWAKVNIFGDTLYLRITKPTYSSREPIITSIPLQNMTEFYPVIKAKLDVQ